MRALLLFVSGSLACIAQINSIATSGDGAQLWFASGYGLQGESDTSGDTRIYSYAPDTPGVVARAGSRQIQLVSPFLSSDGQTSGWRTYTPCFGSCMLPSPRGGLVLTRNGNEFRFYGRNTLNLSRSGRWLYEAGFPNFLTSWLNDLDNGTQIPAPGIIPLHPRHAVSNSGIVVGVPPNPQIRGVIGDDHEVLLWTAGTDPRSIYRGDRVLSAAISADGQTVLVATTTQLIRIDPNTKEQQVILSSESPVSFSMDTAASRVAVLVGRDVVLSGMESKPLYSSPEDVRSFELSDDGSTLYVATARNRLIRVNVDTTEATELYRPMIGAVQQTSNGLYPGSAIRFHGAGFADDHIFASAGLGFPVVKISEGEFQVQIPWEYPIVSSSQPFQISAPGSPFESRGTLYVDSVLRPWIFTDPYSAQALAAQQDFSGTVTEQNPAPAGSTIHVWLTGLGMLDQPLRTGEVGPADPPARPVTPLACYLHPAGNQSASVGLSLPFVAYAPGLLGLYQVDLTIPEGWPSGKNDVFCTTDNRNSGGSAVVWTR